MNCIRCNAEIPEGKSRCPICQKWHMGTGVSLGLVKLSTVKPIADNRIRSGPWDKCFGGGIVPTTVTLIGGSPGAGKSTLLLKIADAIASKVNGILYVSAEEAIEEIKSRADWLGIKNQDAITIFKPSTDDIESIQEFNGMILLDSLPGLVGEDDIAALQVCRFLKGLAVQNKQPVIIIDHITKADSFAGRMTLQHTVDALMTFYPDETEKRVLHVGKNRHGPSFQTVSFEFTDEGLNYVEEDEDEE